MESKTGRKRKIKKAAGLIIENKKLLVERSRNDTYLKIPGGKVDSGESFEQALIRELKEEVSTETVNEDFEFLKTITFETSKYIVKMKIYIIKKYKGRLKPNNEVSELGWACKKSYKDYKLGTSIENNLIKHLLEKKLI